MEKIPDFQQFTFEQTSEFVSLQAWMQAVVLQQ